MEQCLNSQSRGMANDKTLNKSTIEQYGDDHNIHHLLNTLGTLCTLCTLQTLCALCIFSCVLHHKFNTNHGPPLAMGRMIDGSFFTFHQSKDLPNSSKCVDIKTYHQKYIKAKEIPWQLEKFLQCTKVFVYLICLRERDLQDRCKPKKSHPSTHAQ